MEDEVKKKKRYFKVEVKERDWLFLSRLSPQTQNAIYKRIRVEVRDMFDRLKEGKVI